MLNRTCSLFYRGADKSLARPGKKQARKHVRDARDFNNIETRAVIKFFFSLQGKEPKEIHAILTETLAFFPARQGAEGNSRHSYKNVSFFPARQGAEGNSRPSDRNISFFPFLVGLRTYHHPCIRSS